MKKEYNSLVVNESWVLVDPPVRQNKWVFCQKRSSDSEVRYKARLGAKGFTQQRGIDYLETFSPFVRYSTIRLLFGLAVSFNLEIDHLDVETAFLHGQIDQEIYMAQPEHFVCNSNRNKVYLLKKALYCLKQSSRILNLKVKDVLIKSDFKQSVFEPCIYFKKENMFLLIVTLYVDDF